MHNLAAEIRTDLGKGAARKFRAAGKIPGVIYKAGGEATHVVVDPARLVEIFRKTQNRNTIVHLQVDGESVPVLVKETQRHPVKRDLLHVDFYAVQDGKKVEVMVPLEGVGTPAGASLGGRVRLIRRTIKARCDWDKIPATFKVDISHMNIGDMIKVSELPSGEGVEVVFDSDFNVLTVYGKRGGK